MKITLAIPEEFEIDYKTDRFKEFFERVESDLSGDMCGNYEREIIDMMRSSFENSKIV